MAQSGVSATTQYIQNSSFDPDLGLLTTNSPGLALRWDDTTTTNVTYLGTAISGTLDSAAGWQIKKIDAANKSITFADGDARFNNIWSDRASLSYS